MGDPSRSASSGWWDGRPGLSWGTPAATTSTATESGQVLLAKARRIFEGELPAIIAPENLASQNVCGKLGFTFWKQAPVQGDLRKLHTLAVGEPDRRNR
jgi:RimJ/RimL family protein N-acetyltransferase